MDADASDVAIQSTIGGLQIEAGQQIMAVAGGLVIVFFYIAGYAGSPLIYIAFGFLLLILYLMHFGQSHHGLTAAQAHVWLGYIWEATGTAAIGQFWYSTLSGTLPRLGPQDSDRLVGCCCCWMLVLFVPHVFQMRVRHRALLYVHALTVVLTSPYWSRHLLCAMIVGESMGYTVQHMIRTMLVGRERKLEQLQQEKERIQYELLLAQHRNNAGISNTGSATRDRHPGDHGAPWRGACESTDGGSTNGTSSEIAGFSSSWMNSEQQPHKDGRSAGLHVRSSRRGGSETSSQASASSLDCDDGVVSSALKQREQALWRTLDDCGLRPHDD